MGSSTSTLTKNKPLQLQTLLSLVETRIHPLNQHLLVKPPPSNLMLPRTDTIKLLTLNLCLVPECFSPLVLAPHAS